MDDGSTNTRDGFDDAPAGGIHVISYIRASDIDTQRSEA